LSGPFPASPHREPPRLRRGYVLEPRSITWNAVSVCRLEDDEFFAARTLTMPLSPAVKAPPIFVLELTENFSVKPLSALDSKFELLTVIETDPFVVPLAAVYAVSVPRSTNITFAALACELAWLLTPVVEVPFALLLAWLFAGVAGCAANAAAGTLARARAATIATLCIRI
jgi:hypothetical protein